MSEWKISPSDGVSIVPNSTGATVAFEPNRPTTVYEVTYTADNGCVLKTTIKLRENCGGECSINGTMNSTKLPATIDSQTYQIGTYWTNCGGEINIEPNEGTKFYDVYTLNGEIYGKTIDANPSTDGRSSSFFLEVNGVKSNELWVSQNGTSPSDPCDGVVDNPDLNRYVTAFSQAIGVTINATDTKCTYSYLSYVYENISNDVKSSDTSAYTVSWALANTMAEITPYSAYVTSYFVNMANLDGMGGIPDLNNGETVYSGRTLGGFEYARIKNMDFRGTNEMADRARKELRDLGKGNGEMISVSEFSYQNPIYVKLDHLIPSGLPSSGSSSVDYNKTQNEINTHPTGTTQAIADKMSSDEYVCENVFGLTYNSSYSNFLEYGAGFTEAANGFVKWNWDYERWRPGAYQKIVANDDKFTIPEGGKVYVASARPGRTEEVDEISYTSACGACGGCNGECDGDSRCNSSACVGDYDCSQDCTRARQLGIGDRCPSQGMNSHQSFPSGHSCKAYFQFLMCVESDGISSQYGRTLDYCYNRVVVRAHWYSDIIAGKYNAASQIGFMNGVRQFHELMP